MKIALVLSSPPGYSETFFNSMIKGLQENGHDISLYTGYCNSSYSGCKHIKHPRVYKFFLVQLLFMLYRSTTLLFHIKQVRRYFLLEKKEDTSLKRILEKIYLNAELLKFKGDWIHFGFCTTALDRELVSKAIGAKMAVSLRGYDMNVFPLKHNGCYDLLWRQVDKVHSISNDLLEKAYRLGLQSDKLVQIIYPAVNLVSLPELNSNMESNKIKIVTIARFNWIKGLSLLAEVAFILKGKGIAFEWVLIGEGDPAEKEHFLFDVHEKQLEGYVIQKGKCTHNQTLDILNSSDIYVQTSLTEGFCNALLEAQAIGIPCVAFDVGGIPENIDHQKTGWLIEPYVVTAMAERIINISALTTSEKVKLSEVAVKRVRDHFNLENQKLAFHEFYTQ